MGSGKVSRHYCQPRKRSAYVRRNGRLAGTKRSNGLSNLSRAPSDRPSWRRCPSLRSQSTSASIALSRSRAPSTAPHPTAPALLRRRRRVRRGILDLCLVPFDSDHRQNDHGRRPFGAAEAHGTSVVGKFQNGTHVGGPAIIRALTAADPSADASRSALMPTKQDAGLTDRYIQALDSTKAEWSKAAWRTRKTWDVRSRIARQNTQPG